MKILAIVAMRNEAIHVRRCIEDFTKENIDVVIIDNGSCDQTKAIASEYLGRGLLELQDLPWTGSFSLTDQLEAKSKVFSKFDADWVIHADADENLSCLNHGITLREGIEAADQRGSNVINFHELVYFPYGGEDFYQPNYSDHMNHYYFFQPVYPRLNRAWKRAAGLSSISSGGHLLSGDNMVIDPHDFLLKHYIVLSNQHAKDKYVGREFSPIDLAKGWHGNRRIITEDNIRIRENKAVKLYDSSNPHQYDFSDPVAEHFWQWP